MSEAVTMPSLMMMTSIVSEESFARDTQIDTHTHTHSDFGLVCLKLIQNRKTFKTKIMMNTPIV